MLRNRLVLTKPKLSAIVVTRPGILLENADPRGIKIVGGEMLGTLGIRKKTMGEDLMSVRDKAGLGYGDQLNKGVLSYENEVFQSVFVSRTSETENSPVNDRYAEGMHDVPPLMIGIYIPSKPDKEIDDS
ncbi:hypothetical protein Tco_1446905 [Tanacetum coccineum]